MIRIAKEAGNDNSGRTIPPPPAAGNRTSTITRNSSINAATTRMLRLELQNTRDQVKTILDELETLQKVLATLAARRAVRPG